MRTILYGVALTAACGLEPVDRAENPPTWTIDHATTEGALLGVWGHGPDDVWAVGGQVDQPLVMHNDGTGWARFAVPGSLLWNVYGFTGTDVYAVGEHGLILHYDGTSWTPIASGTDLSLFGLWGASADDVWIVGGDIAGSDGSAVVLRGTRGVFAPVATLPAELHPNVVFKVHGFGPDDVILVGSTGVLRWNGIEWRQEPVPLEGPLFSTWGRGPDDVYAVGGRGVANILHYDGRAWSIVSELAIGSGLSGVFTSPGEPTIAVGSAFVFELGATGGVVQPTLPESGAPPYLHGVWGDGEGTTYVAGGDLYAYPHAMTGVILRRQ